MQLAIELPDELGRQVMQKPNMQEFIKFALEKELSAEQQSHQIEQELFSLMAKIPSSVSLIDELIQDRRQEAIKEQQKNPPCC